MQLIREGKATAPHSAARQRHLTAGEHLAGGTGPRPTAACLATAVPSSDWLRRSAVTEGSRRVGLLRTPRRPIGWSGSLPRSDWLPRTPSRAGAWRERRFAEERAGGCERRSVSRKRSVGGRRMSVLTLVRSFVVSVTVEWEPAGLPRACLRQPPLCVGPAEGEKSLSPDEK